MHPSKNTREEFEALRKEIQESSLRDFKDWVHKCVSEMEEVNEEQGNTTKTYNVVKHLAKKTKSYTPRHH